MGSSTCLCGCGFAGVHIHSRERDHLASHNLQQTFKRVCILQKALGPPLSLGYPVTSPVAAVAFPEVIFRVSGMQWDCCPPLGGQDWFMFAD